MHDRPVVIGHIVGIHARIVKSNHVRIVFTASQILSRKINHTVY